MSLEATIAENTAALRELIAALSKGVPTTVAQVEAVVTEAKAEKTKPAAKVEKTEPAKAETFPDGEGVTYQDAAAVITKLSRIKGRDAAVALLAKFGAAKLPDVKPEQFADVIDAANAELGV